MALTESEQAKIAKSFREVADVLSPLPSVPPVTTPPVDPGPVVPGSGGTVVTGNFPGRSTADGGQWKKVFEDDFPLLAAEGQFLQTYSRWGAYPTNFMTTSKKGYYDPGRISVVELNGGNTVMQCRLVPGSGNANGKPSGCAPYPRFSSQGDARSLGKKLEIRARVVEPVADWHIANLEWPISERWPQDAEIDWWEQDTDGTIGAFLHYMNGVDGGDQKQYRTSARPTDWHVIGFEWVADKSFKLFLDGKQLSTTVTSRVPSKVMRTVLQLEDGGTPTEDALIQYDWITIWTPVA